MGRANSENSLYKLEGCNHLEDLKIKISKNYRVLIDCSLIIYLEIDRLQKNPFHLLPFYYKP